MRKSSVFSTRETITELHSFSQSGETGLGLKMAPTVLLSGIRQVSIVLFTNKIIKNIKFLLTRYSSLNLLKSLHAPFFYYACMYTLGCSEEKDAWRQLNKFQCTYGRQRTIYLVRNVTTLKTAVSDNFDLSRTRRAGSSLILSLY